MKINPSDYVRKNKGTFANKKYMDIVVERSKGIYTDGDVTLQAIADKMGMSYQGVQRLFIKAMAKLLKGLEDVPGTPAEKSDAIIDFIRTGGLK